MEINFDIPIVLTGLLVFLARVADVSLGTMRTISIVHGRSKTAFLLGFLEVSLWLIVITAVLNRIADQPILAIFYALGFSAGNVVGIFVEKRIGYGNIVMVVISPLKGQAMAAEIRSAGFMATLMKGEGKSGPVTILYVVCRRKNLNVITAIVKSIDSDAFYTAEHADNVSKLAYPILPPPTGWRSILKRK
jgi:uncharacterized protein YebE (UPF0316 family)